jgi:hypothetical protein
MKKVLFPLIFICLVSTSIIAQNKQGSLAIGGTFNLDLGSEKDKNNNVTTDGPKTTGFTFIPSAEYFISDKFSAGIGIGYDSYRTKEVGVNTTTITTTGAPVIKPFARMYFSMGEKVSIFAEGSIYLEPGKSTVKTTTGNVTTSTSNNDFTLRIGITPGLSVSLSDKIALDATFGFIGYKYTNQELGANNSQKNSHVVFAIDPASFVDNITFGVKFFLF